MNLTQFFKDVVKALKDRGVDYALAGGLVASVYRKNERLTNDLDFLITSKAGTEKTATSIIRQFKLVPHTVRNADLAGGPLFAIKKKNTTPYIVAGRPKKDDKAIGLDFILPSMPWFEEAIKRAQYNKIDFGFGPVPSLTKEDVIISKFYSLKNDPTRFNDLDDLKSIMQAGHEIDMPYICGQMQKLKISVPESLKNIIPKPILMTSKRVLKELRKGPQPRSTS